MTVKIKDHIQRSGYLDTTNAGTEGQIRTLDSDNQEVWADNDGTGVNLDSIITEGADHEGIIDNDGNLIESKLDTYVGIDTKVTVNDTRSGRLEVRVINNSSSTLQQYRAYSLEDNAFNFLTNTATLTDSINGIPTQGQTGLFFLQDAILPGASGIGIIKGIVTTTVLSSVDSERDLKVLPSGDLSDIVLAGEYVVATVTRSPLLDTPLEIAFDGLSNYKFVVGGSGSSPIDVNGTEVTDPNFIDSSSVTFGVSGSDISLTADQTIVSVDGTQVTDPNFIMGANIVANVSGSNVTLDVTQGRFISGSGTQSDTFSFGMSVTTGSYFEEILIPNNLVNSNTALFERNANNQIVVLEAGDYLVTVGNISLGPNIQPFSLVGSSTASIAVNRGGTIVNLATIGTQNLDTTDDKVTASGTSYPITVQANDIIGLRTQVITPAVGGGFVTMTIASSGTTTVESVVSGQTYIFEDNGTAAAGQANVDKINFIGSSVATAVDTNDSSTVNVTISGGGSEAGDQGVIEGQLGTSGTHFEPSGGSLNEVYVNSADGPTSARIYGSPNISVPTFGPLMDTNINNSNSNTFELVVADVRGPLLSSTVVKVLRNDTYVIDLPVYIMSYAVLATPSGSSSAPPVIDWNLSTILSVIRDGNIVDIQTIDTRRIGTTGPET